MQHFPTFWTSWNWWNPRKVPVKYVNSRTFYFISVHSIKLIQALNLSHVVRLGWTLKLCIIVSEPIGQVFWIITDILLLGKCFIQHRYIQHLYSFCGHRFGLLRLNNKTVCRNLLHCKTIYMFLVRELICSYRAIEAFISIVKASQF